MVVYSFGVVAQLLGVKAQSPYAVTFRINPSWIGNIFTFGNLGELMLSDGQTVSVSASACLTSFDNCEVEASSVVTGQNGFHFTGWASDGGIVVLDPQEPVSSVIVTSSGNLTANFSGDGWMSQGTWLFLHGMGSHPSVWHWVESFMQSDEGVPKSNMMAPQLPNYEPLGEWANNLVTWMSQSGMMSLPDGSVKVVAHSFGAAVTLFPLRTAYALRHGNAAELASSIGSKCTDFPAVQGNASARVACYGIVAEIQAQAQNSSLWVEAANKIGAVYLYHGAIRGGCCACTGVFPTTPQTAASACVLGDVNPLLWYPISDLTWDGAKTIVNIYGFAGDNHQCSGLCSSTGNVAQDKEVTEEDQRLLSAKNGDTSTVVSGSYTEVFGGYYCHSDFSNDINGAAEAMVHTIAAYPPPILSATLPVLAPTLTYNPSAVNLNLGRSVLTTLMWRGISSPSFRGSRKTCEKAPRHGLSE
jgi:hypothetical protein